MAILDNELILSFEGVSVAEANRYAAELAERLRDADEPISVRQVRIDMNAQDFGATLAVILATPAILALAKGVSSWLAMRPNARVTIKSHDEPLSQADLQAQTHAQL